MSYLYHRVPAHLTGSVLYPLNTLKQKFPAIYTAHAAKYVGRETLTQQIVPPLGCLWNDALHFSPVHPNSIYQGLLAAGFEPQPMQWFEAEPLALNFNRTNTAIFLHPPKEYLDFTKLADAFAPFDYALLSELSELPEATLAYYRASRESGQSPLLFHRIPHILYRGSLHVKDMTLIRIP
ncbi:hypothetical protein IQ254_18675 [Nodosilinea sp. LEGE 07088]|uniref:hypothetical protein n=1 Tax=Nodosilinea sp. LEGE 07088 TaxID=2777968 RepID=UPI00187F590B|nr:hypothetical protein [Nodosilinea sp. LEGE 07088]MBE9139195.1 hypothetical protein [Nodosilinea sp. LEGE 07088]